MPTLSQTDLGYAQKAKLKLGKGKQTPSNAVDTSFKARCKPTQPTLGRTLTLAQGSYHAAFSNDCYREEQPCSDNKEKTHVRGFSVTPQALQCGGEERYLHENSLTYVL